MRKVYNFSAGPGMLAEEVLLQAQEELLDWQGTGMSIMEVGHRGPLFKEVVEQAEADLRELLAIPKNYHILFLAGGASTQFAMIPLNLLSDKRMQADYVDTGLWSRKALTEAKRYGDIRIVATLQEQEGIHFIPADATWQRSRDAVYLHYTPNETITGVEFNWVPKNNGTPLVVDMSSNILSRPIDVVDYGIIYAGAQKNIGQAGITLVIIRDDLVQPALSFTPTLYRYQVQVQNHSFYNTPPTYSWYIAGLTLAWMKRQGGLKIFAERNQRKAAMLYQVIDTHADFYKNTVRKDCRSQMNVVFHLLDEPLTERFLQEANQHGLVNLKGHRENGGIRASIYNAMPEAGVALLAEFMQDFAKRYG